MHQWQLAYQVSITSSYAASWPLLLVKVKARHRTIAGKGMRACACPSWHSDTRCSCRDVQEYARVGPPVMYVVRDLPVASQADIDAVCGSAGCRKDSLVGRIASAAQSPASTFVGSPAASWIDDFFAWVSPELPDCCRKYTKGACSDTVVGPFLHVLWCKLYAHGFETLLLATLPLQLTAQPPHLWAPRQHLGLMTHCRCVHELQRLVSRRVWVLLTSEPRVSGQVVGTQGLVEMHLAVGTTIGPVPKALKPLTSVSMLCVWKVAV
jgi:hypothetical protein